MTEATTPHILITRRFDAPPKAVFQAWTEPGQFAAWFGTAETSVEDVAMDVCVGGAWSARMILGDGSEIAWHGAFTEVDPPRWLSLTITDRPGDVYDVVTVAFDERDGGTEMTFTQSGDHMAAEQYREAEHGWRAFFDDLAAGLAS
jgi:uncharacterized protein YndB with AHSA1/START domain